MKTLKNSFLEKTRQGQQTIGTFLGMGNAASVECSAMAGMDYFIADTEHGPMDVETVISFIMAAEANQITPLVRVKDGNRNSILKMLDIGAQGLIIPFLHSVEEMKAIVSYGKYYPIGERGVAFARGAGYGYADHVGGKPIQEYFDTCNRETLLIPQCETKGCLEHIEEITAMEGIDGIFVGPFDLSVALGIPTQFDHPDFKAALKRIQKACKDNGKFTMIFCANNEVAKTRLAEGFDSASLNMDYVFLTEAYRAALQDILG